MAPGLNTIKDSFNSEIEPTPARPKRSSTFRGSSSKMLDENSKLSDPFTTSRSTDPMMQTSSSQPAEISSSPEPDDDEDDDYDADANHGSPSRRKIYHKTYNPENGSPGGRHQSSVGNDSEEQDESYLQESARQKAKPRKAPAIPDEERIRKAPENGWAPPVPLPKHRNDVKPYDKMMLERREAGDKWADIIPLYVRMTGNDIGKTTLSNRHSRIKALFTEFNDEDDAVLLQTKLMVEDTFEKEKWVMIQKAVEMRLGRKLPDKQCLRRFEAIIGQTNDDDGNGGNRPNGIAAGNGLDDSMLGHGNGHGGGSSRHGVGGGTASSDVEGDTTFLEEYERAGFRGYNDDDEDDDGTGHGFDQHGTGESAARIDDPMDFE